MSVHRSRERFDSMTVTTVIVLIAIIVLLNWPFEYVNTACQYHQPLHLSEVSVDVFMFERYEMISGGFPLKYLIREEDDPAGSPQFWSPIYLGINLVLGLLAVAVAGFVTYWIGNPKDSFLDTLGSDTRGFQTRIHFAAVGTGLATILTLGSVLVWNHYANHNVLQAFEKHAIVVRYAIVPKQLVSIFPSAVLSQFAQIRSLTLVNAPDDVISETKRLKTLCSIGFIGKAPSSADIDEISRRNPLKSFTIKSCGIDSPIKEAITSISSLRRLQIISCNGLADGFHGIENFKRLKQLYLVNCDLPLSAVRTKRWAASLETLHLSRPRTGKDSLTLGGLINLKTLNISRVESHLNDDLVEIRLRELPSLEQLFLETMQKLSIEIVSATRLQTISFSEPDLNTRNNTFGIMPAAPWLESLRLHDVPSLRELQLDGLDLNTLEVHGAPNLQRISINRYSHQVGFMLREAPKDIRPRMQGIVNALGKIEGPTVIDLTSLPLDGIDLSPLATSQRLRSLILVQCGIDGSQLPAIAKIPNLTSLDIRRCPVSDVEVANLLDRGLPLREMLVNSDRFERIEVINQASLRGFVTSDSPMAKVVNITDSPELSAEIILGKCLKSLCIRDARSLLGISIDGPIPRNSELHGFRALRFFAIGGPQATDRLCDHLWQCTELDHLTIAYGRLSRQALANIGQLTNLTVLSLPGSETDDSLIRDHWRNLHLLSDVNLSDSNVTSGACEFLICQKNLQKLSLNHCPLNKNDLAGLSDVKQLIELEVAGVGLTPETLQACLGRGMLDRLDLSDSVVSDEIIEILASKLAHSLLFLGLQNCGLNDHQIRSIVDAHPRLAVDVSNNPISDPLIQDLSNQKRLIDRRDRNGFLRHLAAESSLNAIADIKAEFDPVRGRIDPHQFAINRP
jgi:hypothetical protein